jgi:Tol biopolymer transport system component
MPETAAYLYELALSPDESQISFFTQSFKPICTILYIMPSQGGEPKEILRYVPPELLVRHSWTPDGENLILAIGNRKTKATKLYKVSSETGQSQYLGMEVGFLQSFSLHPSGKYLAISSGKASLETWVMENFLPQDIK